MTLERASHQTPGQTGRAAGGEGEAQATAGRDEARSACQQREGLGQEGLLQQALSRENMTVAWKRVKANRGSAGVDGLTIDQTAEHLKTHWPRIRTEILSGTYRPQAVRRVEIPKPLGGTRELGIPTVVDRLIQQAVLQVLQPLVDPSSVTASVRAEARTTQCVKPSVTRRLAIGLWSTWTWCCCRSNSAAICRDYIPVLGAVS